MTAMNVALPHWVKNNAPSSSTVSGATEMNANATYNWMNNYGVEKYGWRVYFKDGTFNGILDEQKVAIWSVDESTLRQDI